MPPSGNLKNWDMTMRKLILILTYTLFAISLTTGSVLANTAANTEIINNATLTFNGGAASATVTVTVALIPSPPNISITDTNGAYTAPDTPALTDSVRITSTANGPSSYTVAPSINTDSNTSGASVNGGATVPIGASVTTGTSGTTYVTVPAGGAIGNDAEVNGIAVNDTIVFTVGGTTYTRQVTSTTDNLDGTFQLNWSGVTAVPSAGTQIGEQRTVNLSVLPGTVTIPGTDITAVVTAVVSTSGVADVSVINSNPNVWTTPSPNVNMTKYVRNLSDTDLNPAAGSGDSFTINTTSREYFTSGVTGQPGHTLEYVIVATNVGATELTGAAISDLIPEAFVALETGVYGTGDVFYIAPDTTTASFTAGAVGANQASFVAGNDPNLIVNVGNGASNLLTGAIPAGDSVSIAYQVTIK